MQNEFKQKEWSFNGKVSDLQGQVDQLKSDNQINTQTLRDKEQEISKLSNNIRNLERDLEDAYQQSQKEKQELDKKFRDKEKEMQELQRKKIEEIKEK